MEEKKIAIIGAGLSGLTAAIELEKKGFSPVIYEADNQIGGRVQTDTVNANLLDRGFQVLLTAYPETQHYLDYEKLNLKRFTPGAIIFDKKEFIITDPLRQPSKLIKMLFSPVGTLADKLKIYTWQRKLKKITIESIFQDKEITSIQFLKNYGFSDKIINTFFRPFFGGIFLENDLKTSSRMLQFVFKMFAEGYAAVPENGMRDIPNQLFKQLKNTQLKLSTRIESVGLRELTDGEGNTEKYDSIIIATDPSPLMPQLAGQIAPFHEVINLYFEVDKTFSSEPIIGLIPDQQALVNNIVMMDAVSPKYAEGDHHLLSISITKPTDLSMDKIKRQVIKEITQKIPALKEATFEFVKAYHIKKALPQIDDFKYKINPTESKVSEGIYLAGDYLLNGSINASMLSGRMAALGVINEFNSSVV